MDFNYYIPTRVVFGVGTFKQIHELEMPGKKALIVISSGKSMDRLGYVSQLESQLDQMNIAYVLYRGIRPNPTKDSVMEGAAIAKTEGCDFIIALGGGSTIDASKAISVMATNPGDYWDYVRAGSGKGQPITVKPLPVVAISTTSGTGSETDPWAVISNEERGEKVGYGGDLMYPVMSIFDPELTLSIPADITAYQGFDALFHCAEGCLNRVTYEISDLFALEALRLIGKYLPIAVANGNDLEARTGMAKANMYAGFVQCLANSTAAHAIEHTFSAKNPALAHGAGLIMIGKAYYTLVAEKGGRDETMVAMARALGCHDAEEPMDFVYRLGQLMDICGVSHLKMSDYGITMEDLPGLEAQARSEMPHMFAAEPAVLPDSEYIRVMQESWK